MLQEGRIRRLVSLVEVVDAELKNGLGTHIYWQYFSMAAPDSGETQWETIDLLGGLSLERGVRMPERYC